MYTQVVARHTPLLSKYKSQIENSTSKTPSVVSKNKVSRKKNGILPLKQRNVLAERLNGRLAMLGFVSGSGCESITGQNYVEQLTHNWPYVLVLSMIVSYASFTSRYVFVSEKKPFTSNLEILNGRLAMMGILCKLIYDAYIV